MVRHCSNAVKRQQRVDSVQGAKDVNGYDPHDLSRFEQAQANQYQMALSEIRGGHKQSHWMWFIFPQFDGLGFSAT